MTLIHDMTLKRWIHNNLVIGRTCEGVPLTRAAHDAIARKARHVTGFRHIVQVGDEIIYFYPGAVEGRHENGSIISLSEYAKLRLESQYVASLALRTEYDGLIVDIDSFKLF